MSVSQSVAEVLSEQVTLEVEGIDQMLYVAKNNDVDCATRSRL
jgi:hypothetical protein